MSVQIDGSTGNIIAIKADYSGDVSIGGTLTYEDVTNIDAVGLITARSGVKFGASGTTVVGNSSGIGVGTDNPGSNKLQVQGGSALYGNGGVSAVWGDTSYLGALSFDGSAQPVIRTASSKALIFQVNQSTEALRITSSGDLCFGSTVGANNDGSGISIYNASNPRLSFRNSTTGNTTSDGSQLYLVNSDLYVTNNENANLILRTNSTERMRIDNSGDYLFLGGTLRIKNAANDTQYGALYADASNFHINAGVNNLLLYTGGGERARIDSSGRLMLGTTTEGYSSGDDLTIATSGHTGITLRSGTTSEGAVYFSDATSGGGEYVGSLVYSHNTNNMLFTANGAERFRIESDGDLKFGNQSSSTANNSTALVHIDAGREYWTGTAGDYRALKHRLYYASTDDAYGMGISNNLFEIQSQTNIAFFTGSAGVASGRRVERMRIDSSGRLMLNTTTSRTMGGHGAALQVSGTNYGSATVNITNNANSSNGAYLFFSKQRSGSVGGNTILQSGDLVGQIRWLGADGTDIDTSLATIDVLVDGTPGSNDMPGRIVFSTTADGASAPTERARITNNGKLLVGTTTSYGRIHADEAGMLPDGGGWLNAALVTSGSFGGGLSLLDGSKGYTLFCTEQGDDFFIRGATGTSANVSGGVKLDNRATSWTSASDEREKENLVSITGAIDKVKTLRTVTGNYTWAPDKDYAFLIAQDVQQVLPEAVHVMNKSAAVEDQRLGIAYTQTIPLLTAALKEAIAEIETLKTKVAALES